jgi:hypothetical protein
MYFPAVTNGTCGILAASRIADYEDHLGSDTLPWQFPIAGFATSVRRPQSSTFLTAGLPKFVSDSIAKFTR